jgi:hypothetical protein
MAAGLSYKLGEGEEYELRLADVRLYNVDEPREATIVAWRLECFELTGIDSLTASSLAVRKDADRSDVERAFKAGASSSELRDIFLA